MNHMTSTASLWLPPFRIIRDKLWQGRVIPFLGSGASRSKCKPIASRDRNNRKRLPTSAVLSRYLARKTSFPTNEALDLAKVAQYYNVIVGRQPLHEELYKIFNDDYPFTSLHEFLADVPKPLLIVTTNYDDLIERAFRTKGREYDVVIHTTDPRLGNRVLWKSYEDAELRKVMPKRFVEIDLESVMVIYKIHGTVDRREPGRDQYVITEDDYIDFLSRMTKNQAIPAAFAEPFQTRHFLFLGYSLRDWNLRVVLNRIEKDLRRRKDITSWAIQDKPSPLEVRFWQERGVEVYDMKIEDFVERLKQT